MSVLASPTSPTSPTHPHPPVLNRATKPIQPKRTVSFMNHATVTDITDSTTNSKHGNTTVVLTGAPGNVNRSSFRPSRRPGYVRKGPVQSDSDTDSDSEDNDNKEEEDEEDEKANGGNGIGTFSSKPVAGTSATVGGVVRPGQNYVRRAPVNSDTESDEEKMVDNEPTRRSGTVAPVSTSTPIAALNHTSNSTEEEENSDTDNEDRKNGGGVGRLVKSMAQTRIAGPGQNYVRKAPVNSDSEDDDDKPAARSTPAANSPAPQQQQQQQPPPHSGESIHNRHLNTALGATGPGVFSAPHSRTSSYDPYAAAAAGIVGGLGVGGMSPAMSSPKSGPVATSPYPHNIYTLPTATNLGMTINNTSNSSLGNLSNSSSNPYLTGSVASASSQMAAASLANSMAIYQQQQHEMMMIMQQQQIQIATMQQQQQAYQLLVYQQQQQHQQQLQAVHQHHSRAASANGSVYTLDTNTNTNTNNVDASDSDDDVPLGEKQSQLPQLSQLPSLPQFSSLTDMGSSSLSSSTFTTPPSPTTAAKTITPAQPNTYPPRFSVQQSPLLQHNRQLSTSSVHSLVNNGGTAYLHQPISSSPLNPATSSASMTTSLLGGQHQVYSGGHACNQTSSQPRLSDFIEEEQERLIREQHLQATAAALGGHKATTPPISFNGGTSLLTSSFPAGYRGSVASVMSIQQTSGIDRGSMTSLHSTGSNGSGGSGGSGGRQRRPSGSRDSFIPQMSTTLIQQQQYLTQPHQYHLQQQQQQQFLPYHQPATLIHVEAKPPPPSAGLVGAISAMERDKKLAKAHGTNQLQFQHQQHQQQMMMTVEKERWLQEQRRAAWEAGQFPQQQQGQFVQQGVMPGLGQQVFYQQQPMMMQAPMQQQPGWTSADEEDDDRPLGAAH